MEQENPAALMRQATRFGWFAEKRSAGPGLLGVVVIGIDAKGHVDTSAPSRCGQRTVVIIVT